MTSVHTSAHKVFGGPRYLGRAEMTGVAILIYYITKLLKYKGIMKHEPISIHCDNMEAVNFANNPWIGTTPKWADERNADLKRMIRAMMETDGNKFSITHVKGRQDREKGS